MLDFNEIAKISLISGAGGGDPRNGLCIMEMVSYFDGANEVTDRPECACPFLTDVAINVNDRAPTQEDRDALKPLLPLLAGSRDEGARKARAWFVMRESVLRILAVRLGRIKRDDLAVPLRAAQTPKELGDAVQAARTALRANANAANANANADAYANAYADAYAYAYANANAADAYAYAYANANAADAYAYAYANAYAGAYAYAGKRAEILLADRRWTHGIMREILTEAIKLGAHGGLDIEAFPARAAELRELVGPNV